MPYPRRKTVRRGAVVVASTALVLGGSILAHPAFATETTAQAVAPSTASPAQQPAVDTTGLAEAIERDLDKTVQQYLEDSELNVTATALETRLSAAGIEHNVVIEDGAIVVQVGQGDLPKAEKLIGVISEAAAVPASASATDGLKPSAAATSTDLPAERPRASENVAAVESEEPDISATTELPEPSREIQLETVKVASIEGVMGQLEERIAPSQISRLTSITRNVDGQIVIRAGGPAEVAAAATEQAEAGLTLEEFGEVVDGVELITSDDGGPAKPAALEDVYGGMGYAISADGSFSDAVELCSLGFNAWSPTGEDAVISAGHCSKDGTRLHTAIVEQDAPGTPDVGISNLLGTFGFNQFGTPGNGGFSDWQERDAMPVGTDISIIEDVNPELNLHEGVTQWPQGADERDQTIKITSYGSAAPGAEICSSGRTTGWGCAEISAEGVFFVLGFDESGEPSDQSIRAVQGYIAETPQTEAPLVLPGDSGGAAVVGNRAVGINSAFATGTLRDGQPSFLSMFTSLSDAMATTEVGNYEVKLFVNAPRISAPALGGTIRPGSTITGTVKAPARNTAVEVIVDDEVIDAIPVDGEGAFSFAAPRAEGEFDFQLRARTGKFNVSEPVNGSYTILAAPDPTPTPTPSENDTPSPSPSREPAQTPSEQAGPQTEQSQSPQTSHAPQPDAHDDEPLARTGSSTMPALALAGGLGLSGGLLLMLRGNNRRHG